MSIRFPKQLSNRAPESRAFTSTASKFVHFDAFQALENNCLPIPAFNLVPLSTSLARAKVVLSEVSYPSQTKDPHNHDSSQLDHFTTMTDMPAADFRRKEEDRLEEMQETIEEQEMMEQQLLDEETAEFGYLEDGEEVDDYRKLDPPFIFVCFQILGNVVCLSITSRMLTSLLRLCCLLAFNAILKYFGR